MATRRLVAIGIRNPEDCAAAPAFAFKEAQLRKAVLLASFLDQPVIFMPSRSYSWIRPPRASGVVSAPSPHRTYLVSSDRQAEQKARNSAAGKPSARGISSSVTGRGWRACRRGPLGRSPRRPAWRGPAGRPCRTGGRARRRRRSPARPPCRTAQGANARRPPQARAVRPAPGGPAVRACGPREARDGQLRNDALAAESQFSALPVRMAL